MKAILPITITSLLFAVVSQGAVPKNPSMNEFAGILGDKSPFIIKKPIEREAPAPVNTALSLRGVSWFKSGWIVTLIDRKEPNKNIILREGAAAKKGIKLIKVNQDKSDYTKTTAVVLTGGRQVSVGFNMPSINSSRKKMATAATAATSATAAKRSNVRPPIPIRSATQPSAQSTNSSSGRRPRVRRPVGQSKK